MRPVARLLAVPLLVAGCAHGGVTAGPAPSASRSKGGRPVVAQPARAPSPQATGVWDWVFRSNDDQGNLRVEQEEWHLVQRGTSLEGYYDRALTLLSLDDHPFRCNQQLGITKFTRVRVAGSVQGDRVRVDEVAFDARPGPCDDGARSLNHYTGALEGSTLRLEWSERQGEQTLFKRQHEGGPRLAEMVGLEERPPPELGSAADPRPGGPVRGVYTWELRSVNAEGDAQHEQEVWHLDEKDGELSGWYERTVERSRDVGNFPCNGQPRYETHTRFEVSGHRTGNAVVLTETGYRAEPGRCENGLRRLDTYQGALEGGGDAIVLSSPSAAEVLRRRAPRP